MRRLLAAGFTSTLVLALAGCPLAPERPGDVDLGTYRLRAELESRLCEVADVKGNTIETQAVLRGDSTSSQAWVTLTHYARDGGWDGERFTSTAIAPRVFADCPCPTTVEETLTLALLSPSQAAAVSGLCPPGALDGGVPAPDADAGIAGPALTEHRLDAQLACGTLVTITHADLAFDGGSCKPTCEGCVMSYVVTGERR